MGKKQDDETVLCANLVAWDEVAPIHRQHNHARLLAEVSRTDFSCLDQVELKQLIALDVTGKDVAQLCCNNGRELISMKKLGAARCVGFDGAAGFIDDARELAAASGSEITFVCSEIHDICDDFDRNFDIVTITIGVLGWMPDLTKFFAVAARLLRPGGALFIYEQHPILDMIKPGAADQPLEWELSYFSKEPYISTAGLDYYGDTEYVAQPVTSFSHTMSETIMAGLATGLGVEHFEEYAHHISNTWWNVESAQIGMPMCYTLVLRKPS